MITKKMIIIRGVSFILLVISGFSNYNILGTMIKKLPVILCKRYGKIIG